MGQYELLHPGITEYHHIGSLVPILAALSPMVLARIFESAPIPQVGKALVFGGIVSCISYIFLKYIPLTRDSEHTLNKAVLLGILVAEMTIFSASDRVPSIVLIALFVFLYFFSIAKAS